MLTQDEIKRLQIAEYLLSQVAHRSTYGQFIVNSNRLPTISLNQSVAGVKDLLEISGAESIDDENFQLLSQTLFSEGINIDTFLRSSSTPSTLDIWNRIFSRIIGKIHRLTLAIAVLFAFNGLFLVGVHVVQNNSIYVSEPMNQLRKAAFFGGLTICSLSIALAAFAAKRYLDDGDKRRRRGFR